MIIFIFLDNLSRLGLTKLIICVILYIIVQDNMKYDKLNLLLKSHQQIYRTVDLGILWRIENKNTLYTTIKRRVANGVLLPIFKGMYSVVPISELDPVDLGVRITHEYCYLSFESILAGEGVISQPSQAYTFAGLRRKNFSSNHYQYLVRRLPERILMASEGISISGGKYLRASLSRAVADMLYINPQYHWDAPNLINWPEVEKIRGKVGYK